MLGPHECPDAKRTESRDPRQDYADPSHPFSIVLPVSNRMDDLEVALQGDDHQTDISGVRDKDWRTLLSHPTAHVSPNQSIAVLLHFVQSTRTYCRSSRRGPSSSRLRFILADR